MRTSMCIFLSEMASCLLFSFGFTYFLIVSFFTSCSSLKYDGSIFVSTTKQDEKVKLSLYYESSCPASADFISENLVKIFDKDPINIVNLRLVPWGNAETTGPNNTFVCQGEDECYFNTIHACAIEALPNPNKHFGFIHCLEKQTLEGPIRKKEEMWRSCCQELNFSEKQIQECYDSGHGRELELGHRNETEALSPPHNYVPWLTINQKHIKDIEDFVTYVCKACDGHHVPEARKSLPPAKTNAAKKAISSTPVCYAIGLIG